MPYNNLTPALRTSIPNRIIVNSFSLALNEPDRAYIPYDQKTNIEQYLQRADELFIYIYTTEMMLKIIGLGFIFNKNAYLTQGWNILDFVIVTTAWYGEYTTGGTSLTGLRSLRILLPLKTIAKSQDLRVILKAIWSSIPMLINIIFILAFFILLMAIVGTQLFKGVLLNRCFNVYNGISLDHAFCGKRENMCERYNVEFGVENLYVCGKMMNNPNWGVTSFDNFFESALMVW